MTTFTLKIVYISIYIKYSLLEWLLKDHDTLKPEIAAENDIYIHTHTHTLLYC